MNARDQDAHLDLCRRLATALAERDGLRTAVEAAIAPFVAEGAGDDPQCTCSACLIVTPIRAALDGTR